MIERTYSFEELSNAFIEGYSTGRSDAIREIAINDTTANFNRIYISGSITGTTDYIERFAAAEKQLAAKGYDVVNPARINAEMPANSTHEHYMIVSYALLDTCGSMYVMPDSSDSIGVADEIQHAESKMPIYYDMAAVPNRIREEIKRGMILQSEGRK
jgi:hypothetical protein